ncbi:hypothetical protein [Bacillus sp. PK3_68]|uniref:hypothetical protein n=1 Tax=Bacillus sp. PK3_68 TaxID=2027408 RepID=UPI000E722D1F|nr:hypothetical protein [Bacillus sp. PK3_68]RJS59824.1 hypothetical protein CJ483_06875 [Bacillus sp. PK3_68]
MDEMALFCHAVHLFYDLEQLGAAARQLKSGSASSAATSIKQMDEMALFCHAVHLFYDLEQLGAAARQN